MEYIADSYLTHRDILNPDDSTAPLVKFHFIAGCIRRYFPASLISITEHVIDLLKEFGIDTIILIRKFITDVKI